MTKNKQPLLRRIVTISIAIITLLLVSGWTYQQIGTVQDNANFPPPGQMVSVGDHALHIHCIGEGSPTIVVDNGAGSWSVTWFHLQEALAKDTRVCLYDRAGLGWSEGGPFPRTSQQLVEELHTLLKNSGEAGPYLLVGHSLGGYNIRLYADQHPEEVIGLVFVESAHEEQWDRFPKEVMMLLDNQVQLGRVALVMSRFGLVRLLMPPVLEPLPAEHQPAHTAAMVTPKTLNAFLSEFSSARESAKQVAGITPSVDFSLPVVVVTARHSFSAFEAQITTPDFPFTEADQVWFELQEELAQLSPSTLHLVSETGTHDINFDDPDLVLTGIREALAMAKTQGD